MDEFGGGFEVRAGTSAAAPIDDLPAALRRAPGIDPSDFTVGRQPVGALGQGQAARHRPSRRRVTSPGASIARSSSTRPSASARWPGVRRLRMRSGTRSRRVRGSPSSTASSRRAATTGTWKSFLTSSSPASSWRTASSTRSRSPSATRRPGRKIRLTVIGILKDTAPQEMAGISSSQATYQRAFPGRFRPTIHYFALAPGVDAEDAATRLESAFLAERHAGRVDREGPRRLAGREPHVQPADPRVHGPRPDRRRRCARRDQRARGGRAAPADRRPAGNRLPASEWCRRSS